MKLKMAIHKELVHLRDSEGAPNVYVLPFSVSLLYQPDDDPSVGLKHVAFVK
jgi:hypothetical protein